MVLEQLAGRLLEDDEGQSEDEADVQTRSEHTGVLNRGKVIKHASQYSIRCIFPDFVWLCLLTYSHSWAVLANTSIQNNMEVVVAGVESSADDANDGEGVQLQSDDGQLQKHMKVKLMRRHKAFSF